VETPSGFLHDPVFLILGGPSSQDLLVVLYSTAKSRCWSTVRAMFMAERNFEASGVELVRYQILSDVYDV
jgi:hypothetical protein